MTSGAPVGEGAPSTQVTCCNLTSRAGDHFMHSSRPIRHILFTAALLLGALAGPISAQEDDTSDSQEEEVPTSEKLEEIREDRELNEALQDTKARSINGTTAQIGQINAALQALSASINAQELQVQQAQLELTAAENRLIEAELAVIAGEQLLSDLARQLSARAVNTFLDRDLEAPTIIRSTDPNLTVRMEALVEAVLLGEADLSDAYRETSEDLKVSRADAEEARRDAEIFRAEMEEILIQLDKDKATQIQLLIDAEARLDFLLFEYSALEQLGQELQEKEQREIDRLAALLAAEEAASGRVGSVASPEDIIPVGGILVHRDIAENVAALLAAAEEDGITFGGGGWRDASAQIRLRRAHCGSSEFAIWEATPSSCAPPTARPGASLHERGLAIDFNDNGRSITSRSSRGYQWLKANAHKYGLFNLPSEPWHWSTTGG